MAARFLVLEGVDGSGKTTQAERLLTWLGELGRDPVHVREPGSTELGERLRALLLDPTRERCSMQSEALLFFAARAELLQQKILPALEAGHDVLCERFTPSTLAYQAHTPVEQDFVLALDRVVVGDHQPDLVLLLDLPAEVSAARAEARAGDDALDGMEARGLAYLEAVREGYLGYARARSEQSVVLNVEGADREAVQQHLRHTLVERFPHEYSMEASA